VKSASVYGANISALMDPFRGAMGMTWEVSRCPREEDGRENIQRRLVGMWLTNEAGESRNWQMYFAAAGLVKT